MVALIPEQAILPLLLFSELPSPPPQPVTRLKLQQASGRTRRGSRHRRPLCRYVVPDLTTAAAAATELQCPRLRKSLGDSDDDDDEDEDSKVEGEKEEEEERHWPAKKTRQTLHFFPTPFNSSPSSLMFLSLLLPSLLLLFLSPLDNRQCLCLKQVAAAVDQQQLADGAPTPPPSSSALVANSIFDSILGRTSNEANPNSSISSSGSSGGVSGNSNSGSSGGYYSRARNNENSAAQSNQQQATAQAAAAAADLHQSYKNGQTSDKVTLPGDILLGGLFPIHMKGTKVECGEINRDRGIQRLEAMLYALDKINEDSRLLPDIKLGAILLDSCSSSTYALNQSLEFIRASINTVESSAFECKDKSTPRPKYGSKMIAGVIGGSYSEVSLQVANLLRLFRIPQVSYASTGTALSDKTLYDLFARTVPSDMFQARAIADIVLKLNWSYVSLVSSEGLYGDSGSKEFMKQASVRRICIATHEKISPTTDMNAYDSIIANLHKRNATGVVLFTRAEDTRELLLAVKRARLFRNFAWVAADGWGTHQKLVEGVEEVALGAITVELQAKAIPGFDDYMKALTPWHNGRNPWFSEYWQEWFDCQLQQNLLQQQQLASGSYASVRRQTGGVGAELLSAAAWPTSEFSPSTSGRAADTDEGSSDYESVGTESARKRRSSPPNKTSANQHGLDNNNNKAAAPQTTTTTTTLVKRSLMVQQSAKEMKQFCSPNLRISESNGYRQEQKVQFVVDAVYAMAHALHKAWANLCDAQPGVVCEALKELNGGEFYSKYLLNVSFQDLAGSEVKFDERGDGLGRYNIYNYRQVRPRTMPTNNYTSAATLDIDGESLGGFEIAASLQREDSAAVATISGGSVQQSNSIEPVEHIYTSNNEFEYSTVGRWTESDYSLKLDDIQYIQGEGVIPESYCSRPCELGQAKIMRAGDHCCWICKTCAPYEFLPDEFSCKDCGIGRWPMPDKNSCFELPQKYLRWDSVYSLISLSIACLGIALTLFVSVIFIKYIDTPVVKASGRELSFILLAGIAFCHLCTFVLLAKPTALICGGQRFLVNFGFSLMYASLLVKTNRISRIFNCARKSAKRPSFISPKSQMLITGILVAIQIFLTIVWFVFEPPGIRADSPEGKRDEVILKCRAKGKSFIISLVYNMILITTCTVYAVKTRKIPENFNESKFIGFTMYTTIVIWLAFVTMFFGTNNSYEIQINTMCVCISLSAYVTLFCLFSPKVSIILLHPDKNVRKLTMNSTTYKRATKQVSSHASLEGGKNGMNTFSMGTAGGQTQAGLGGYNTTCSGGYIGSGGQPDGPSGGPMSTTSNMLNPVDSQAASRLQESSIVSNVVNSNSAGSQSNGSQSKTPTTLSQQQLVLVGTTCANCGSHQLTQQQQHQQQQQHHQQPTSKSIDQTNSANLTRQVKAGGPTNRSAALAGGGTAANQQISRSSILISTSKSSSSGGGGCGSGGQQARVLHSSRGATKDDAELLQTAGDNLAGASVCRTSLMKKRQMASLSKLNELNLAAANSSANATNGAVAADESSSSLANDSFNLINTSLENTPCNMPIGHAISKQRHMMATTASAATADSGELANCGHYISGKGSDSMLWNQSDYSIDYCSDCCPDSYCNCSCQVCLSSNGAIVTDDGQPSSGNTPVCIRNGSTSNVQHPSGASAGGGGGVCRRVGGSVDYIYHTHHQTETSATPGDDELELELERALVDDSDHLEDGLGHKAMIGGGDDDDDDDYEMMQQCNHRKHHHRHPHSNWTNVDQDGHTGSRIARIRRRKSEEPTRYRMDLEEAGGGGACLSAAGPNDQHRDSLTTTRERRNQHGGGASDKKRSQAIEMRTIQRTDPDSSSQDSCTEPMKQRSSVKRGGGNLTTEQTSSVAYALQTAAHSAMGACAANAQVTTAELQMKPRTTTAVTTSIKDKPSERVAGSRQQLQPQQHQQTPPASAGPIQASIELVKQVSHQMQQQQLWSKKASTSYHDDYEYSYGLVQPPAPPTPLHLQTTEDGAYVGDIFDDKQLIPVVDPLGRTFKLSSSRKGSKYEIQEDQADELNYQELLSGDACDRDDDDNDYDVDDFEHDGRLSLNRSSASSGSQSKTTARQSASSGGGSRSTRTKQSSSKNKAKQQSAADGHRINSVTLIAATLSAGGAIVESGTSSSSTSAGGSKPLDPMKNQQSNQSSDLQKAHLH